MAFEFDPHTAIKTGQTPESGQTFDSSTAKKPGRLGFTRSAGDSVANLGASLLEGAQSVTNIAGADNRVSRALGDGADKVRGFESVQRRIEHAERNRKIQEAEASGSTWDEVKAYMGAFAEAPFDTTVGALGTSAPMLVASALTRGRVAPAVVGGAQGVGIVKGEIHDAVEQAHLRAGASPEEAAARASAAQAYGGDNAGQIALGGGLGVLAGSTGVESIASRLMGQRAGQEVARRGVARSIGRGMVTEGPTESVQGGQERLAANLAVQNEGFDVPTWQGVAGSAALEGTAGMAAGGGFGAVEGFANRGSQADPEVADQAGQESPPITDPEPVAPEYDPTPPGAVPEAFRRETPMRRDQFPLTPSQAMGIDPNGGPLSSAAALSLDSGVSAVETALEGEWMPAEQAAGQVEPWVDPGTIWDAMPEPERQALAGMTGIRGVLKNNVSRADWARLSDDVRGRLEAAMGQRAIEGREIDGNWTEFAPQSGTLGIARSEMPQIKAEHRGAMVNFMKARGIAHQEEMLPAASLRPTQAEFSREKVAQAKDFKGGNRAILVSADNHVLDGHHQWLAARQRGEQVRAIRLNAPIEQLIQVAHEFPSTTVEQVDRPVLQNRDRSAPVYVEKMTSIAANPDYGRLGFSRDFTSGAPAVEPGARLAPEQVGATDHMTTAEGRRIPVQYAVVEADQLLASNSIDGSAIPEYIEGAEGMSRAIAGNGRVAGLQAAHGRGTAGDYVQGIIDDARLHGVAPEVVEAMRAPILVRIMPQDEITDNIGDESNTPGTARLTGAEQARNDTRRVDLSALTFSEDGGIADVTVRQFVQAMPSAERATLLDGSRPSRQAHDRLESAVFASAYESDALVRLQAQAVDPEARNIMRGLLVAAPKMARLSGAREYDIRGIVAEAAEGAINARRSGRPLAEYVKQVDLSRNPEAQYFLEMFAENARSAKRIGDALSAIADAFYAEATRAESDMFGEVPRRSRAELLGEPDERAESTPEHTPATGNAGRAEPVEAGRGRDAAERSEQAGDEADPGFALTTQTEEELAAQAQSRAEAEAQAAAAAQEAEQRAQADQERDGFTLSGSDRPADVLASRGQGSLLDAAAVPQRTLDEHVSSQTDPNPTDGQKEAGNYRKASIKVQGLEISIENARGSKRSGVDADGNAWSVDMKSHYGYIRRTEGADGEHVDVFVGPNPASEKVYVVDQINPDGTFDEHKVLLGFDSHLKARSGYKANYSKGWKVGPITSMTMDEFKAWLKDGDTAKPLKADELINPGSKPSQETQEGDSLLDAFLNPSTTPTPPPAKVAAEPTLTKAQQEDVAHVDYMIQVREDAIERLKGRVYKDNKARVQMGDAETDRGEFRGGAIIRNIGQLNEARRERAIRGFRSDIKSLKNLRARIEKGESSLAETREFYRTQGAAATAWDHDPRSRTMAVTKDGVPFKTEQAAKLGRNRKELSDRKWVPVEVDGGWALAPEKSKTPTPDLRRAQDKPASIEIEDAGERLGGARKDELRTVRERLENMDDEAIASSTLSKMFPKSEIDKVDNHAAAAIYHAAREEIPAKPRKAYRLKQWVESVRQARELIGLVEEVGAEALMRRLSESGRLRDLARKIEVLNGIDRDHWSRVESVSQASGKYAIAGGETVSGSWVAVRIDGRHVLFYGHDSIQSAMPEIRKRLEQKKASEQKLKFAVYQNVHSGEYFIAQNSDKERRELKRFGSPKEARAFVRDNHDDLVAAWEAVKNRDNVTRTDMRRSVNAERTGTDHRDGKDISPQQFLDEFGFRGVEFGNWVRQGRDAQERQSLLNDAYDAFMDLAEVLSLPPKALSLEGRLGIGMGSRGRGGRAAAHYEPDSIVINLTKTKGAGSLAHEWFHALDNYFARKRGEPVHRGDDAAYRREAFVTYRPEPMMVRKDTVGTGYPLIMSQATLEQRRARSPGDSTFAEDAWIPDPNHKQSVRPVVERAFAELVKTLDESPMTQRASVIDKGKVDGYWSQIIERAARSFETYVIARLADRGYRNDFLANVQTLEEFARNPDRYPYLTPDEQGPVNEAFDRLFDTLETQESDSGIALYSRASVVAGERLGEGMSVEEVQRIADEFLARYNGNIELKAFIRQSQEDIYGPDATPERQGIIKGAYHPDRGVFTLAANNLSDRLDVERTLRHEILGHYGLDTFAPADKQAILQAIIDSRDTRSLRDIWSRIDELYSDRPEVVRAEEVFAAIAETDIGTWGRLGNQLLALLAKALRAVGLSRGIITRAELLSLVDRIGQNIREGRGQRGMTSTVSENLGRYDSERAASNVPNQQQDGSHVSEPAPDDAGRPEQFNLFTPQTADRRQAYADLYGTIVQASPVTTIRSAIDHVRSIGDVAHVMASIRKDAQESFYAIATDANDKILRVMQFTHGTKDAASVFPLDVVAEAAGIDGITTLHLAHNHPSDSDSPSRADAAITQRLGNMLDGTGIELGHHAIVANTRWADGSGGHETGDITPRARTKSISITQRRIRRRGALGDPIRGAEEAIRATEKYSNALLLLNTQNTPVAVVTLSEGEMTALRQGGQARRVLAAISKSNASRAIIKTSSETAATNLSRFLNRASNEIEILDWINGAGESGASRGRLDVIGSEGAFFSRSRYAVDEIDTAELGQQGTQNPFFKRWFGQSKIVDRNGEPLRLYHSTDSSFTVFDSSRAGESTGHASAGLGFFLTPNRSASARYGQDTMEIYARIENPYQMGLEEFSGFEDVAQARQRQAELKAQGYDGIQVPMDGTVIAFEPNQLKSATDNIGTFDPNDPDIRFRRASFADVIDRGGSALDRAASFIDNWWPGTEQMPDSWTPEQKQAASKFDTFSPKQPVASVIQSIKGRAMERATQLIFDQFRPLKNLSEKAFMQAHLSKATDGAIEALATRGVPILKDGAIAISGRTKGFLGELSKLGSNQEARQFLMWVAGNRAENLAAEGRENLFTDADIAAMKSLNTGKLENGRLRSVAYAETLKQLNIYNKAVLDIAQTAGLINAESRSTWESEFYIPFYRVLDDGSSAYGHGQTGLVRQNVVRRLKGGTENLGDPLENVLSNWHSLMSASMRNMAGNAALDQAVKMNLATKATKATRKREGDKDTTWTMRNGQKVYWHVDDPMIVDALSALNFNGYNNGLMRVAGKFKRALTVGVTISPAFRIRNLMRDTMQAVATADVSFNPLKNAIDGWDLTRSDSETMTQLMAGGGAIRFGVFNDGQQRKNAERLISMGVPENQILDSPSKWKNAFRRMYDGYQELGDRAETINRAVIYQRVLEQTGSHLEASFAARDLMNFTSMGSSAAVRALAQVLPFFNARLQGLDRLARGAKADPRRFFATAGVVAMASALLYLLQSDDEEYRALPDYVRDTYWPIKIGGHWLYIPKPFELGSMGTVIERFTEMMFAGDDYQMKDFRDSMIGVLTGTLAMNPVPQMVRPAAEAWFNYDMFRQQQIDGMGMQRLLPEERYTADTSAVAVQIGRAFGASPQKIEHLMRGYFGWLGTQALNVGDHLVRSVSDMPASPRRDMTLPNNWFVVGEFVRESGTLSSKYVERFYSVQRDLDAIYASANNARRAGDYERAGELMSRPEMAARPTFVAANRQLSNISQQIRQVTADRNMSASEKNRRLMQLRSQRDRVAREADQSVRASL